ncbi:FMN-dependent NADH-azoreductase [Parasphingorhabdus halotolerans]|uniref:FMN dependent NADH:quinone oxidoreductase n=1 Tax=Parasphingorhabdus halotolerans TaxID=2725558 RepID=A0A6H2DQ28_9SPHN|nr:NAD(P)H-dependent oxidoreductase [Parasphingorhabdus halotolerans]QJB70083.1 FMN-dependent NADH-azoreductase [Parasphingorhabdus halotolerans]
MTQSNSILRIDASARKSGSSSRRLTDSVIEKLAPETVTIRDLTDGVSFVTEDWVNANFTDEADRTHAQKAELAYSDALVEELVAADTLVIGTPIYNFGVPAALKAWIDMIARARKTFHYTANGPEGLLTGKKAYVLVASGGTEMGSAIDFASGYLRHVLGFVGITDVTFIAADQQMVKGDAALDTAMDQVSTL